jgi:hypothetical protein
MSISNPTEGPQLLAKAIRDAHTVDTIGDIVTFTVKVISPPIFRSAAEVADLTGESKTPPDQKVVSEGDPEKIQQFQGRIESEFFMSPHLPIPDPCSLSYADSNNAQLAFAYAALHTTCFTPLGWSDGYLKVGDRCRVTMRKGDFKMDLQYATVDSLQSSYLTVQSEASKNECSTLASLFEDGSGTLGEFEVGDTSVSSRVRFGPSDNDASPDEDARKREFAWNYLKQFLPNGAVLTSAVRTQKDQNRIINNYAIKNGYKGDLRDYKAQHKFITTPKEQGGPGLIVALNVGKGHGAKEGINAFDISGADLDDIWSAVLMANAESEIHKSLGDPYAIFQELRRGGSIIERTNNAVHVQYDLKDVVPGDFGESFAQSDLFPSLSTSERSSEPIEEYPESI